MLIFLLMLAKTSSTQQRSFAVYGREEGLLTPQIFDLKSDSDGFLWIANGEGINIYDGTRFQTLTIGGGGLSDAPAWRLIEARQTEMWVGTSKGIDVFRKRKKYKTIDIGSVNSFLHSYEGGILASITSAQPNVMVIENYVARKIFSWNSALILVDKIAQHYLLNILETDSFLVLDKKFNLKKIFKKQGQPIRDGDGGIWWLSDYVYPVDTTALMDGIFKPMPVPPVIKSYRNLTGFYFDKDSYYWLSDKDGLTVIDNNGFAKRYTQKDGLPPGGVQSLREDREGNLWGISPGGGVVRFHHKNITSYTLENGLKSFSCWSVAEHKSSGSIWIAQSDGISCYYKGKVYFFPHIHGNKESWLRMLISGDSLIINAPVFSMYKISFDKRPKLEAARYWPASTSETEIEKVNDFAIDQYGCLWVLGRNNNINGLFYISSNNPIKLLHNIPYQVRLLLNDDKLWIGGWGHQEGLWNYKIKRDGGSVQLQLIRHYNDLPGNAAIRSICKDDSGNIWAGTRYAGLLHLAVKRNDDFAISRFTKTQGLSGNWVRSIRWFKNKLFVATDHGLNIIDPATKQISDLPEKSMLIDNVWDVTSTNDNELWLATETGAIKIDRSLSHPPTTPSIFITSVEINDRPDSNFDKASVILNHRQNNLSFSFSSTSLRYEKKILYSFILVKDGEQTSWSIPSYETRIAFAGLRPGKYTFKVKAVAGNNLVSTHPAIYSFAINKPFWQRNWFYVLSAFIMIITFYFIFREIIYRRLEKQRVILEKEKAIEIERLRISAELHDDLGGGLSTIRLLSEMISNAENGEHKVQLGKISFHSKELVQKMNEIVWALNIKNDTLTGLLVYIRQYVVRFMDDNLQACDLSLPEQIPDVSITGSRRRDIFLLIKESLNNIIKHARASKVNIEVVINNSLQIIIHDNGVGFDTTDLSLSGNGLLNMRKRTARLWGTMTIKNHNGTTLIFDIPLKNMSHESVQ